MATKTKLKQLDETLVENRGSQQLFFSQVSRGNRSKSNLTELNATDALDSGFMSHSDWMGHAVRYGFINDFIARKKPLTVLDVGCGRFPLLNYMWKNRSVDAFDYTGLDLRGRREWFEHLRWKKGDVHLVQMDLVLDEVAIVEHDLVISTETFEHVPADKQPLFMKQLYNWTTDGGYCIFSTPNAGVSKSTAENHKDENGRSREMSYKDKLRLAESVGFKVQNTFGVFIAKRRIPESFWNNHTSKVAEFLPNAMLAVFAAAAYPAESNNSLFILTK